MNQLELINELSAECTSKLVLFVMDGLGGLPGDKGFTTLEAAVTPHLDQLASDGICGLSTPVIPGITAGSGPGHLGLFGYNPLEWEIGRGVLEGLGIGFPLGDKDVAARGNFCTIDLKTRNITDRRAGRISTAECVRITDKLKKISIPGIETFIEPVQDYRFLLVFRGDGLCDKVTETDPQRTGLPSYPVEAKVTEARRTAELFNAWKAEADKLLEDEPMANSCNLRGIAKIPAIPQMPATSKMKMGAIASYPMYRGLARLIGMDVLGPCITLSEQLQVLKDNWDHYDFFFFHVKKTDSYGEDGNFEEKKKIIEEADKLIPAIRDLKPDVLVVTGDHSTPVSLKSHSWHEVPILLWSKYICKDEITSFGERPCMKGGLGHIRHTDILRLMMANGQRLNKYGA